MSVLFSRRINVIVQFGGFGRRGFSTADKSYGITYIDIMSKRSCQKPINLYYMCKLNVCK